MNFNINKKDIVFCILIIISIVLGICNSIKINKLSKNPVIQNASVNAYTRKRVIETDISTDTFIIDTFSFYERTSIKNDKFIISLKVPRELKKEDVLIYLNDNKLSVSFETEIKNNKNARKLKFKKEYELPNGDVKLEDIVFDIKRNKLEIVIPLNKK
jgi:hypothetical protein